MKWKIAGVDQSNLRCFPVTSSGELITQAGTSPQVPRHYATLNRDTYLIENESHSIRPIKLNHSAEVQIIPGVLTLSAHPT
jgi:hypothetical protein